MKRIISIIIVATLTCSLLVNVVGAVSYTDLQPTYSKSSNKSYYNNSGEDDKLQYRANCYGYALRLHYGEKDFPTTYDPEEEEEVQTSFYNQLPREFYDKSNIGENGMTYEDLSEFYAMGNPNSITTLTYLNYVIADCQELGYTLTSLCANPTSDYVPPAASTDTSRRLVAIVSGTFTKTVTYTVEGVTYTDTYTYNDCHFYIQNNDTISNGSSMWSHKKGNGEAISYCDSGFTSETIKDDNICEHLNCYGYDSTVVLFYIDAPGFSDKSHGNGMKKDANGNYLYQTPVNFCDNAGNYLRSAKSLSGISYANIAGSIDHKSDIDYYIFDVTTSGTYDISLYPRSGYTNSISYGTVTSLTSEVVSATYSTSSSGNVSFSVTLTAGNRYFLKVTASGQTEYNDDRDYWIYIERSTS